MGLKAPLKDNFETSYHQGWGGVLTVVADIDALIARRVAVND